MVLFTPQNFTEEFYSIQACYLQASWITYVSENKTFQSAADCLPDHKAHKPADCIRNSASAF